MTKTIPYITEDQSRALNSLIGKITKEINAEKIICFGSRTTHNLIWSSFLEAADEVRSIECDLLILTNEKEKAKRDEFLDIVVKENTPSFKFTVLVHGIEAVNEALKKGSYFFSTVLQKGVLLFDSEAISLNSPKVITQSASELEVYWRRRHRLSSNFLNGATHALEQGWNDQAMFLLHQAVEHTCATLIKVYLGYKTTTHRLSKLLSMVENFSLYSISMFPRITKDEVRLFTLLEKAYSDSRYDEKYAVSTETTNALRTEVEDFMKMAEGLFQRKTQITQTVCQKHDVAPFESIGLDTFARVVLKQGENEIVEVESKYGSGKSILLQNEDNRLCVSTVNVDANSVYDATVYITYKKLSGLVVHHAESVVSEDVIEAERLGVINNSAALIELNVEVLVLDVTLNKHGKIILSGFADEAKILNNRSGEISARDFEVTSAKVVIRGSGNVAVNVEDELHAELRGSGNLFLTGSPRIKAMAVTGTGTLKFTDNR
jgi:HEPN domain-containing protein